MSAEADTDTGAPTRQIHQLQESMLSARRQWARSIGTSAESAAHREFHEAVMDAFTALRPLFANSNATEHLWTDEELWIVGRQMIPVAACPACGSRFNIDKVEIGDYCPDCGDEQLQETQMPAVDEETGEPIWQYVEGLQSLEQFRGQREVRTVQYSDALGRHTKRVVEKQLLDPHHLEAAADAIDEGLERLGLHADVDDTQHETELDQETIEAFQERVQEVLDDGDE